MTVGLPGTGIGGLFYLLCAFAMPIVEVVRNARGRRKNGSWRVAAAQFSLALAMFSVLAATGLFTDYMLGLSREVLETYFPSQYAGQQGFTLGVIPTFITLGVLCFALLVIEITGAILIWSSRADAREKIKGQHVTS